MVRCNPPTQGYCYSSVKAVAITHKEVKLIMTNSPSKHASHLLPLPSSLTAQQLTSPRSSGRLRKLQSQPSLISQQRQQQHRNTSASQNTSLPPIPALPSPPKHSRARSNSDAVIPTPPNAGPSPKRNVITKKPLDPKDELRSLIRYGPRGDVPNALQNLRHWILVDGLEADTDGMVKILGRNPLRISLSN